jgi:enolase-phosphatase E1
MTIQAILTDIEGTTSSLAFVKEVLFPYAYEHMQAFVVENRTNPAVAKLIDDVRYEVNNPVLSLSGAIEQLKQWIRADKKITPLKAIQGLMWQQGYANGDFTGHVYADAVAGLQAWQAQGLKLYVYSSGSVAAQKLLFAYSDAGDLTPLFSGYFDTQIGHKREVGAYQHIAQAIGLAPKQILFLSDIREELDAAKQAGMQTCSLVRENQATEGLKHPWVENFAQIDLTKF